MNPARAPAAQPFFLPAGDGGGVRFCLYHAPRGPARGAILYAPPFAEELNRTRRMAALQARRCAGAGYAVLQIDLFGCGDSDGAFGAARWEHWLDDLARGAAWLGQRHPGPVGLWGTRLGALLALDYARQAAHAIGPILLWQPVTAGSSFLNQFLRLRLAADMLTGTGQGEDQRADTASLRAQLAAGSLEVAGYDINGALAAAIDPLELAALAATLAAALTAALKPGAPLHWFDIGAAGRQPAPGMVKIAQQCRAGGATVHTHLVDGAAFWAAPECGDCPALIDATVAALELTTTSAAPGANHAP